MIITIKDIRAAGMCASGARKFAIDNGFDWSDFIKNGIDVKKLENMENPFIKQVIEAAKNGR